MGWSNRPTGDRLMLWDTPGFGDSLRLARRLALAGNPIGWFLSEVWDRWRDRAFWSSQRALRNVLEQADVVLYLVNASEAPEDAGYLDAELQVLSLIGKPVIALLNQLGPAGAATDDEAQQIERWRARLHAAHGRARGAAARRVHALLGAGGRVVAGGGRRVARCTAGGVRAAARGLA